MLSLRLLRPCPAISVCKSICPVGGWISRRNEPSTRWRPNAVFPCKDCKGIAKFDCDPWLEPFTFRSRQANDLAGRPQCHCEFNCVVEVPTYADIRVETLERDAGKSSGLKHRALHVRARHRERSG